MTILPILEAVKLGDNAYRQRVIDLKRVAKEARAAAQIAEQEHDEQLAKQLNDRADLLDELADKANIDIIDQEATQEPTSSEKSKGEEKQDDSVENGEEHADTENNSTKDNNSSNDETNNKNADTDSTKSKVDQGQDDNSVKSDNNSTEQNNENSVEDGSFDPFKHGAGVKSDSDNSNQSNTSNSQSQTDANQNSNNNAQPSQKNYKQSASQDTLSNNKNDSLSDDSKESSDSQQNNNSNSKDDANQQDKNEENNDSEESSESNSDDQPIKDPFADEEDIPSLSSKFGGQNGSQPRDATIQDIIDELNQLEPNAKAGAIDGITELINGFSESLQEKITKGLRDYSDDEFNNLINDTLDLVDKAKKVNYVSDVNKKKAEVKKWSSNTMDMNDLKSEDDIQLQKDYQAKKAREKETSLYKGFKGLESFKINFYNAIRTQVDFTLQDYQTYNEINPEYEGEDIILKADVQKLLPEEAIPVVDVYFDCSGSWSDRDIALGKRAIASIKEFEDAGEIKLNIFYFANHVYSTPGPARDEGGTMAWYDILNNISKTNATNVVIMTDSDMNGQAKHNGTVKVDGCVWWLWKNGDDAPACAAKLIGKQSGPTGSQYMFVSN